MADASKEDCPELRALTRDNLLKHDSEGKQYICLPLNNFRLEGPNGSHLCFVYPLLDLTASNLLLRTAGLNELPEHELIEIMGKPELRPVTTLSGDEHEDPKAPQYLVLYPTDLSTIDTNFLTGDACINDLGQSFEAQKPPDGLGTPTSTGRKLFSTFDDDTDEYLFIFAMRLGKFPEPLWSKWEDGTNTFQEEPDELGRVVLLETIPVEGNEPRSLREVIQPGWYNPTESWNGSLKMCDKETGLLADLLEQLLALDPERRLSAQEASEHEWFKFSEEGEMTSGEDSKTSQKQQVMPGEAPTTSKLEQTSAEDHNAHDKEKEVD
ncbi:hypothetical protein CERZMDRAFT_101097 [Cercospora zeae-maydis SCOH1-5]|uniref:Protein kinase domain-containing protein n=1 Tax=Cercospora zeae-maydis SCOH1-5 TaxID=717836 RepID=A0A6A6F806_9PEZI|nr:hypothetical protein CERZMDRAFT_101097 [Cercospora zeae-maydis SCOH1-5]